MSDVGDAVNEIRLAYAEAMPDIMPDVCTITIPGTPTRDDYNDEVPGSPSTTANVPCSVKPLSAFERLAAGGVTGGANHEIELPYVWADAFLNVPPTATVTVAARDPYPARTFSVTGPLHSSDEVIQRVAATLRQ